MKPQKLYPAYKDYLWGGTRLVEEYGKQTDLRPCAESWELAFHPDGPCRLSDGRLLSEAVRAADLGGNADPDRFPMLIKWIDAKQDLSVQVHPSDRDEPGCGKTEMWYVAQAAPGAALYVGFCRDVTEEELARAVEEHRVPALLNRVPVHPGDVFFIPPGTVHAIGAGCLICEVQQNSNVTYRVYDYGRKDKNGKERQLHVAQALRAADLRAYTPRVFSSLTRDGELLGASRSFTLCRKRVTGKAEFAPDPASFRCLICLDGGGTAAGEELRKGDSFFLPANQPLTLTGDGTFLVASLRRYGVGIDLGGSFIKGGLVNDLGEILVSERIPTCPETGAEGVTGRIADLCRRLIARGGLSFDDVIGVGIGVPGMIDKDGGEVVYSNNLQWSHFPIAPKVRAALGLPVRIANDANAAVLGEVKFGAGKGYQNAVLLTLGTGVGGGIVVNGRLYEGSRGAGAELGHMILRAGGRRCTCGRRGCLEAYASAAALIRAAKRAAKRFPQSALGKISPEGLNGSALFRLQKTDPAAKQVVQRYLDDLAEGVTDVANIFRPDVILLGGGLSAVGKDLTDPVVRRVRERLFGGDDGPLPEIKTASCGNDAGILGAYALLEE